MKIPQVHRLSTASQLSLLAIVILMGAVFFTVNSALQEQQAGSHASGSVNIVINHSFESGKAPWWLNTTYPGLGEFTTTTIAHEDGNYSAQVEIDGSSSDWWKVQLQEANLPILQGTTYTISYWAKASTSRGINSVVQNSSSPYAVYAEDSPTLTTAWKLYSYTFKATSTQTHVFLGFNLASARGTVWIDNVSFSQTAAPTTIPQPTPTCAPPPTCYRLGAMICLLPRGGWCGFTPTVVPTLAPTVVPTCVQPPPCIFATPRCEIAQPIGGWCPVNPTIAPTGAPTAAPTAAPTQAPLPTVTYAPGSTLLNMTLGLHGVGTGGDSANPNSDGNMLPLRQARTVKVDIYDAQNQLAASQFGTVAYNSSTGKFNGTINLGSAFATGLYTVKVKTDQYLRAIVPGIQTITQGQTNTLPTVTLVAGDINGDNTINIVDYNILIGCYSDLLPAVDCTAANNVLSDLNDDGNVNQFDYNLFLRELTNIGGQ